MHHAHSKDKRVRLFGTAILKKTSAWLLASRWFHLALALILLLPALSAYGQFESASVLGYARDNVRRGDPKQHLTLTNIATGIVQKATTDTEAV